MKKIILIVLTLILSMTSSGFAVNNEIKLIINGERVPVTVAPIIENGSTLVPLRIVSENLGAKVEWNEEQKSITLSKDGNTIKITPLSKAAFVNEKKIEIPIAPKIIDGTTLVPIRFVSENLDCDVIWDKDIRSVNINEKKNGSFAKVGELRKVSVKGIKINGKYYSFENTMPIYLDKDNHIYDLLDIRISANLGWIQWVHAFIFNDYFIGESSNPNVSGTIYSYLESINFEERDEYIGLDKNQYIKLTFYNKDKSKNIWIEMLNTRPLKFDTNSKNIIVYSGKDPYIDISKWCEIFGVNVPEVYFDKVMNAYILEIK